MLDEIDELSDFDPQTILRVHQQQPTQSFWRLMRIIINILPLIPPNMFHSMIFNNIRECIHRAIAAM